MNDGWPRNNCSVSIFKISPLVCMKLQHVFVMKDTA